MGRLIGVCGRARSGKDVVATYLQREYDFVNYKFSEPLKRMLSALLGCPYEDIEQMKQRVFNGYTVRTLMQTLGTEWGRETMDSKFWINVFIEWRENHPLTDVVISDIRFENEAEQIKRMGGTVIEVTRPGIQKVNAHKSEDGIPGHLIDIELVNDTDIATLEAALEAALRR